MYPMFYPLRRASDVFSEIESEHVSRPIENTSAACLDQHFQLGLQGPSFSDPLLVPPCSFISCFSCFLCSRGTGLLDLCTFHLLFLECSFLYSYSSLALSADVSSQAALTRAAPVKVTGFFLENPDTGAFDPCPRGKILTSYQLLQVNVINVKAPLYYIYIFELLASLWCQTRILWKQYMHLERLGINNKMWLTLNGRNIEDFSLILFCSSYFLKSLECITFITSKIQSM